MEEIPPFCAHTPSTYYVDSMVVAFLYLFTDKVSGNRESKSLHTSSGIQTNEGGGGGVACKAIMHAYTVLAQPLPGCREQSIHQSERKKGKIGKRKRATNSQHTSKSYKKQHSLKCYQIAGRAVKPGPEGKGGPHTPAGYPSSLVSLPTRVSMERSCIQPASDNRITLGRG